MFPKIVQKLFTLEKVNCFHINAQKIFRYELRIHFVPFFLNIDPNPNQFTASKCECYT